jgi:hypothetical protein
MMPHEDSRTSPRRQVWARGGVGLCRVVVLLAWTVSWIKVFGPLSLVPGLLFHGGWQMVGLLGVVWVWVLGLCLGWRILWRVARQTPSTIAPDAPRLIERMILEREWVQPSQRR